MGSTARRKDAINQAGIQGPGPAPEPEVPRAPGPQSTRAIHRSSPSSLDAALPRGTKGRLGWRRPWDAELGRLFRCLGDPLLLLDELLGAHGHLGRFRLELLELRLQVAHFVDHVART